MLTGNSGNMLKPAEQKLNVVLVVGVEEVDNMEYT